MQNSEKPSKPTSFLYLVKKVALRLVLITGGLAGLLVLFWVFVLLYEAYGNHKNLSYMTSDSCSKHDSLTQICETEEGHLYLRRVDIDNKRMSVTDIADDPVWDSHRYRYKAFWFEPCEEGVEVETNKFFSDGLPWVLTCETKPNWLLIESAPSRLTLGVIANEATNFILESQGFSIEHDYSDTDYSPLLRKHALTSTEIKRKRKVRLEKAAEEKRIQLIEDAKKEEAKRKKIIKEELALKASCEKEIKNRVTDLSEAEHTILNSRDNKNVLDFYCQAGDGRQIPFKRNTCTDWRYIINNPTNIEIESLVLRYGIICGHIPKYEEIINTSIPPTKSIAGSVPLESNDGCAKITAVKFKSSESPIKECDRR